MLFDSEHNRRGEILKKRDSKLGCEFLYTFWDFLYSGVFGYAESKSLVCILIFCLLDLFFRGQKPIVEYEGQTSCSSHYYLLSYVGTSENHVVTYQTVQQKNTLQKIIILTTSGFDDIVIRPESAWKYMCIFKIRLPLLIW